MQRGLTQPVTVGEYTLHPGGHRGKGRSYGIVSLIGIAHAEKYWPDAQEFRPERFKDVRPARSGERSSSGEGR